MYQQCCTNIDIILEIFAFQLFASANEIILNYLNSNFAKSDREERTSFFRGLFASLL